ncbi:hypothetical protein [Streptomyces sp. NBC_01465]|uniref:hypothetical protein n=1 Tax=Streptomyces sp. NBC_01465 TaxID=2903878 RepID=UPI002E344B80|nr:hypothetical protein [Streptomyces sp. NBC_01465]
MQLISMAVLLAEVLCVLVVHGFYLLTLESPDTGINALGWVILPVFLVMPGTMIGALISFVLVLPAVWLSGALGRRFGGREVWWWVAPASAAVALAVCIVGFALAGSAEVSAFLLWWAVTAVALAVPALVCRSRNPRVFVPVAGWGVLAVLCTVVLGTVAFATGLVHEYRPPALSRAALVGEWSDGRGGTLTFTSDGRLTARRVEQYDFDAVVKKCAGEGTWTYRTGKTTWDQEADIDVRECSNEPWNVGGTPERPTLYRFIGDPDSEDLYVLRKAPSSP